MFVRSLPGQHRKVDHDNVPPDAFQFFIIYSRVLRVPDSLLELQIRKKNAKSYLDSRPYVSGLHTGYIYIYIYIYLGL